MDALAIRIAKGHCQLRVVTRVWVRSKLAVIPRDRNGGNSV